MGEIKVDRTKEAFEKRKLTNDIEMIKQAHSRLFNQFKQLENDFNSFIVDTNLNNVNLTKRIKELENYIDNLVVPEKQKEKFVDGNTYYGIIENIISMENTKYDNKDFVNMLVKLESRLEIYKVFVLKGNQPKIKDKIIFTFDEKSNRLAKIKIR